MKREYIVIILGILIAISPWSGIPMAWLEWFYLLVGIIFVAIGVSLRNRS